MILNIPETSEQLRQRDPILWRSLHQFDNARPDDRHYGGTIIIDGQEVAQTLQCCHCGGHFINVRIPGKERGWCFQCQKPVCPKKECDRCTPWEKQMEAIEKNLPLDQLPIKAAIRNMMG